MVAASLIVLCLIIVSLRSRVHGIGMWLLILITHGLLYEAIGEAAVHLPLFSGAALAVILVGYRQWSGVSLRVPIFLLGLFLLMGVAALFGIDHETSLVTLILYARCFIVVILIAGSLKNEKDLKIITAYCLVGIAAGALAELYQYKTGSFTIESVYVDRAASLRGDPNDTAMILVAGVPLAVYWFTRASRLLTKGIMVLLVLLLAFGMILTASRGGFVALSVVTMIMFLRKPSFKSALVGIFLASSLLVLAPNSYWNRMSTLLTGHGLHGGESLAGRFKLLKFGLVTLANHPLLGVGPGNYGLAFARHADKLTHLQSSDPYPVAHNMYLQFFVENGLIGGALFVVIFGWAAFSLLRYDRANVVQPGEFPLGFAIASAFAGMLFAGLFLSEGLNSVLWFMTGAGFAAGNMAEIMKPASKAGATRKWNAKPRGSPVSSAPV